MPAFSRNRSAVYLFLALLWLAASVCHAEMNDFWEVDDYLGQHPEQLERMTAFSARVAAPAQPLNERQRQIPVIRIAKIYPAEQDSDYWRRNLRAFDARMDELGLRYQLTSYFSGPTEDDLARQLAHLELALTDDPDYLVYTLSSPEHVALVERIIANGRPKVILQNITTPLHRWDGMQPFMYVGFDHRRGTRMLAGYMRQHSQGNYAVLKPAPGYLSLVRGDSFVQAMSSSSQHRLVDTYHTDLDSERAYHATLDALQRQAELSMIYASSTDIALGAARALRQQGRLEQVLLNGWGGGTEELQALRSGLLDVTVMRLNDDSGVAIAEAISQDSAGKGSSLPLIYSGEMVLVDRQMSTVELEGYRRRAFRYSGMDDSPR